MTVVHTLASKLSRTSLVGASLLALTLAPSTASAGAWTMPQGHGQAIITLNPSEATKAFDDASRPGWTARTKKLELQALIEFGANDWLTLIATPALQRAEIGPPVNSQREGFGHTEIGVRTRFLSATSYVLSGQATLRVPSAYDQSNPAAASTSTGAEIDVRALLGVSIPQGAWPAFVDVQLAQRFRTSGPPDEFRADVTLGLRPRSQWLLLAQVFNTVSEGAAEAPFLSYRYHKLQMSAVYEMSATWSLQGGLFTTYAGRNALQENGLILGAWYKF